MDYEGKLRRVCDKHDTKFIEYRPQTGSWVFRVGARHILHTHTHKHMYIAISLAER